jgi:hypothetical protein
VGAHDAEPRRSPRGGACVAHTFADHVRARPELGWTALTDADKTAAHLYGLAVHSTWVRRRERALVLMDRDGFKSARDAKLAQIPGPHRTGALPGRGGTPW